MLWALLPLILLCLALALVWILGHTGKRAAVALRVDSKAPVATVGRGTVAGDSLVLEVTKDGGAAVAVWPRVTAGLSEFSQIRCDCVPSRLDADVRFIWRRADRPDAIFNIPVEHELGATKPLDLSADTNWRGNIISVGVVVRGYEGDVLQVRGLTARRDGVVERLYAMLEDWEHSRPWDGQSINVTIVGTPERALRPVAIIALVAGIGLFTLLRTRPQPSIRVAAIVSILALGWIVLDARWQGDLLAKVLATFAQYGTGSIRERWRAAPDGEIFALADAIKQKVPLEGRPSQRVFVFGDESYARGRAAYHLLPLSVHYDAVGGALPDGKELRPGDLIVLLWSRHAHFVSEGSRLVWETGDVRVAPFASYRGIAAFRVLS